MLFRFWSVLSALLTGQCTGFASIASDPPPRALTTCTTIQHDGPNHPGLRHTKLRGRQMALITSPRRYEAERRFRYAYIEPDAVVPWEGGRGRSRRPRRTRRRTEDGGRRTEDGGRRTEDGGVALAAPDPADLGQLHHAAHSAAHPSPFSRCFNSDGEGMSAE